MKTPQEYLGELRALMYAPDFLESEFKMRKAYTLCIRGGPVCAEYLQEHAATNPKASHLAWKETFRIEDFRKILQNMQKDFLAAKLRLRVGLFTDEHLDEVADRVDRFQKTVDGILGPGARTKIAYSIIAPRRLTGTSKKGSTSAFYIYTHRMPNYSAIDAGETRRERLDKVEHVRMGYRLTFHGVEDKEAMAAKLAEHGIHFAGRISRYREDHHG